ncbi:MAG: hypothetical protein IJ185_02980, partial [Prevotella sp.]|nr:hypothetical protein [Prevotella sp.]
TDEKVPLSTKVKLTILALLALILVDNHYGFSHTVINSYKVDYMMKLEAAKRQYKEDTAFVTRIDRLIEIEHNRKGAVQKFRSLLSPKVNEKQLRRSDQVYQKILEERDPIIHTFTGSLITLLSLISGILAIIISLFRPSRRSIDMFFWGTIMAIVAACMTYYIALAWALLDPICGRLWVNYILQFIVNIVLLVLIVGHIEGYGHREEVKEEMEKNEIP